MYRRALILLIISSAVGAFLLVVLGTRVTGFPPMGALLDPAEGMYRTARRADSSLPETVILPGVQSDIRIVWDDRRVPHIFASNLTDAVTALGYVHATDRLFQLDFIPRAASGRLAEALGVGAIEADRFLRRTGMDWGARRNLRRILEEDGVEARLVDAYCTGVNARIAELSPANLPFEFRLLGYRPDRCTPIQPLRVLQYMNFDLSYWSDEPGYSILMERLSEEDYDLLYPLEPHYSVPIIPPEASSGGRMSESGERAIKASSVSNTGVASLRPAGMSTRESASLLRESHPISQAFSAARGSATGWFPGALLEGIRPGKGSNNWAVSPARSATGSPILAGDMHLSVTLPAIWYEVHIVTPDLNVYGVSIPGAPLPVEAFNDHLGWAFTNTGSDQIDHYLLEVDSSETGYRFDGAWRDLEIVVDTISVNRGPAILDTLYYTHWGPARKVGEVWIAEQWVAHDSSRTLRALWGMIQATSHDEFQGALRYWDTPMQNILYADRTGNISIRSTGYLPIRASGSGRGLLDGSTSEAAWIGRVPFDELPYALNPVQGFLTSTNQKPTDSSYPYYLGHGWERNVYRSIRANDLLESRPRQSVSDFKAYQADVHVVQRDLFVSLLDTLSELSGRADEIRRMLSDWSGTAGLDRPEPIAFHYFLRNLERLTWDEPVFHAATRTDSAGIETPSFTTPNPATIRLYHVLATRPESPYLDIQETDVREDASDLLRAALDSTAAQLEARYGWFTEAWLWRNRHHIRFNHLIAQLTNLGRGPIEYPGFTDTLSPAADTLATHSASWRVIVDFSTSPPTALGVYPGGQSGNPFSRYYDSQISTYVDFEYYTLLNPRSESSIDESRIAGTTVIQPSELGANSVDR